MFRRFLKRLEQRVESILRKHMNFVDDVDLVARADKGIADRVDDLANVLDAGMRGGVHFDHVDMPSFSDRPAGLADVAWADRWTALTVRADAVERLGDKPRRRCLADPADAGEQERMRDPVALDGVG